MMLSIGNMLYKFYEHIKTYFHTEPEVVVLVCDVEPSSSSDNDAYDYNTYGDK